jgi:phage virion morphogenesis protein
VIKLKVDTRALEDSMMALIRGLKDRRPLMKALAADMADAVEENFKQEGRPAWLGWSPSYARRRKGGKILQKSGRLASSIVPWSSNTVALVGTNVKYAAIHQEGGTITIPSRSQQAYYRQGKNGQVGNRFVKKSRANYSEWHTLPEYTITMPARPFLTLADTDITTLEYTTLTYLKSLTE